MPGRPKTRARKAAEAAAAAQEKPKGKPRGRNGGALPGNQNARKHGFYSRFLDAETRAIFERRYAALLDDPRAALLADAAMIQAHVEHALERSQGSDGRIEIEREEVTGVGPTGPIDSKRTRSEPVAQPASRALFQATLIVERAMKIDPNERAASDAKLREVQAKAAVLEKEAAADGASKEPIEIIVREYKEPPEEGGGESS